MFIKVNFTRWCHNTKFHWSYLKFKTNNSFSSCRGTTETLFIHQRKLKILRGRCRLTSTHRLVRSCFLNETWRIYISSSLSVVFHWECQTLWKSFQVRVSLWVLRSKHDFMSGNWSNVTKKISLHQTNTVKTYFPDTLESGCFTPDLMKSPQTSGSVSTVRKWTIGSFSFARQ